MLRTWEQVTGQSEGHTCQPPEDTFPRICASQDLGTFVGVATVVRQVKDEWHMSERGRGVVGSCSLSREKHDRNQV